jgi:membrane protease YdiL (CAAX protease family)
LSNNSFPRKRESWELLLLFILFGFVVFIPIEYLKLGNISSVWIEQLGELVFVAFVFYYYSKKNPALSSSLLFSLKSFLQGFLAYFIIFLLIDELFVYALCKEWKPISIGFTPKWLTALGTVGLLGPVVEEILFRGVILKLQTLSYGLKKAILFNGLIFGILHFGPLPGFGWWSCFDSFAHGFFFAVFLSIVTDKTKNLSFAFGFHIANNFLTLVTM